MNASRVIADEGDGARQARVLEPSSEAASTRSGSRPRRNLLVDNARHLVEKLLPELPPRARAYASSFHNVKTTEDG